MTCGTAVGSGGHAGTVGGMQEWLGVSIGGVAGLVDTTGATALLQTFAAVVSKTTRVDPL